MSYKEIGLAHAANISTVLRQNRF